MKRIALALFALFAFSASAFAQTVTNPTTGDGLYGAYNTSPPTCVNGSGCWLQTDANGILKVNASVSASITGFPGASPTTGTPISVTSAGTGVTGTLPAGAVVVASNVGATNGAYCKLGASSTTSDQLIPPNSWFAFTVGAATQLTCITSTSTTTVNMVGGSGLPTGSGGGGGGGGGGGAVTVADGADVTQGALADAAVTAGATGSISAKLRSISRDIATVIANTAAAIPTQSSTVPIGGTSLCDGANGTTNPCTTAATVKAASTAPATTDKALVVGIAPNYSSKGGIPVVNGGSTYQAVAASQTATVLQTSTGATGDYLSHCVIYPTSTSPGVVTVFDNTNTAATSAILFAGGASSTSNLTPISVPVGAVSTAGAWKVTTGSAVSVVCYGKFS